MDLLKHLNINEINPGAFSGQGWQSQIGASRLPSFNPATGGKLAEIATCSSYNFV
ncbi:hypothetical protein [Legionella tunisiensis]|uniref:hypothetical protein n=1 Tax=Legionella tunisiensis TaxID=1034944 RepID=UPI0002DDCD9C|nr:hypothetical protein [Legionella tunisiensis]